MRRPIRIVATASKRRSPHPPGRQALRRRPGRTAKISVDLVRQCIIVLIHLNNRREGATAPLSKTIRIQPRTALNSDTPIHQPRETPVRGKGANNPAGSTEVARTRPDFHELQRIPGHRSRRAPQTLRRIHRRSRSDLCRPTRRDRRVGRRERRGQDHDPSGHHRNPASHRGNDSRRPP